jgi:hypothetical protein
MGFARILFIGAVLGIFAGCGSDPQNSSSTPSSPGAPAPGASSTGASVLLASGGTGTSGSGGTGGSVYVESYGSVKVLKSGTVDASFPDPAFTPHFGGNAFTVSTDTTVLLDEDPNDGNPHLYAKSGDPNLYLGNGNDDTGDDLAVTGLTVNAGATLVLVDQGYWGGYGTLQLTNDLVVYGTVTTDLTLTSSLYIEANVIDVESGGMITVSGIDTNPDAGEIYLGDGYDMTKQIINRGTIEAKGLGSGSGGNIYSEPQDLFVNYGTLDTSGGSSTTSGGNAGWIQIYVDYGNFYSSGTVRMNGGDGGDGYGGDSSNNAWIETAYYGITSDNGDIIISGTWEANGGNGTNGNGGSGGYWGFEADAMGAVTINATMSTRGGNGTGTNSTGGNSTGIYIDSENSYDAYPVPPAKIRIAGQYDLRGGDGDLNGGNAGYIEIYSNGYDASYIGTDVEFVRFPEMNLNAGDGATSGGSASNWAFEIYAYSPGNPAGPITNEAKIEARGGKATDAGGTGGMGGYVDLWTDTSNADPTTTITNSGNIDISGGIGDTAGAAYGGGSGDALRLQAEHVTNSGNFTADGGNGTTAGGNGGNITLYSNTTPTTNSGTLSAAGGTGPTPGSPGTRTIDGSVL